MYLVDVNVLVYAQHRGLPQHEASRVWLERNLSGHPQSVALPWPTVLGFLRIATNRRIYPGALTVAMAWRQARRWLAAPAAWTPVPGPRHGLLLDDLIRATCAAGNGVSDLHLAALAMENGLTVVSADADFGRLPGVRWVNPLRTG